MTGFFTSLFWFIITLSILVAFHEFGHFWVARKLGVKVLRFSIGFGKPLWSKMGGDGTEYVIAGIPLGGYVKFLDEREMDVPANEVHRAFNRAELWKRTLIVLAGPVFNLIFAVFAFWLVAVVGKVDLPASIGATEKLAATAGLRTGDRIVAVDGRTNESRSEVFNDLLMAAIDRRDVAVKVREADGDLVDRQLLMSGINRSLSELQAIEQIGIRFAEIKAAPEVVKVTPKGPAANAGMKSGDQLVGLNGKPVTSPSHFIEQLQIAAKTNPSLTVRIARNGQTQDLPVTAYLDKDENGKPRYRVGIEGLRIPQEVVDRESTAVERYGPLEAIPVAFAKTWKTITQIGSFLKNLLNGAISPKMLSGPVGIAQIADYSASEGFAWFVSFLALLSVNLGLLNLLPVPVLDGGHLMYYLIEWIKGGPLSDRALIAGQYVGLALLGALMILVFHNDIFRILGSG